MKRLSKAISCVVVCCVMLPNVSAFAQHNPSPSEVPLQAVYQTPEQLQRLVAPIAFRILPTPANGRWSFDTGAGAEEMQYRQIGENETRAREVCRTLSAATLPADARDGYEFRAVSGANDARTAADASRERTSSSKNINGIAFVSFPTEYRSSGVVTFIVTRAGRVYAKDLGPDTPALVGDMGSQVRAAGWREVDKAPWRR